MAAPAKRTIELFYDVASPYSWIGFETLCRYSDKWNLDLKLRPFFLAGIMKGSDNPGLMVTPNKIKYMMSDLNRLRKYHKIPIKFPSDPAQTFAVKGTMQACRLLTATSMYEKDALENVSRQLWLRIWSRDEDISEPASLIEAMRAAGLTDGTAQNLVSKIKDQEVKDKLKERTETALKHGAFGSPTILVHDSDKKHMFFGSDRFHVIASLIGETYEGPLTEMSEV
ncbi:glutathione S-transferase kappa 1-like [Ptychodera flava]|uniref:glutathione S-transferase kappa 1-like n=1 Tax=Ptychodera flava TaxID=63121 RepID=UPI003969F38C